LLLCGRQPHWLAGVQAPSILKQKRPPCAATPQRSRHVLAMIARGMLWALLPCGLLYSALALAILAGEPVGAGLVMAAFGLGTSVGLLFLQGALRALLDAMRRSADPGAADAAGLRVGGLLLTAMAGIALAAALAGRSNPFCS
jgi:sulfite exporter TauE/SafE